MASRRNVLKGVGMATIGAASSAAWRRIALAQTARRPPRLPSSSRWTARPSSPCWATGRWSPRRPTCCSTTTSRRPTSSSCATTARCRKRRAIPRRGRSRSTARSTRRSSITLGDLMSRFPNVTYQLVLECGGNGRSFFEPEARGNQWTNGGVGLPAMDRRAPGRRAEGRRPEVERGLYRPLRRRSDARRRDRQAHHLARHDHQEGDGRAHADRLQAERPGPAADPRRAGAPDRAGLGGLAVDQVAQPHLGARQGA